MQQKMSSFSFRNVVFYVQVYVIFTLITHQPKFIMFFDKNVKPIQNGLVDINYFLL